MGRWLDEDPPRPNPRLVSQFLLTELLGMGMDAPNPATLRPQVRAAWRALLPLEVSLLLTGQGSSARTCTIRLHDAVQQRLPQCTMSSLSTFLTPAAVCAQVNCRLNVM